MRQTKLKNPSLTAYTITTVPALLVAVYTTVSLEIIAIGYVTTARK
jgi:hypothetical protein